MTDTIDTGKPRILPELADLIEPVDAVTPWPNNPRRGDRHKIAESLREHGQYAPILVQASTGRIIKGNNTWHVMRELGATDVAVRRVNVDDDRARRILAMDNRSSDGGDYDRAELAALLDGLDDLSGTGWDPDDLDDLLAELESSGVAAATVAPGIAPPVYDEPPATDAAYAEDPERERQRLEAKQASPARAALGLVEMILVMPDADRAEAARTIGDIKHWLGEDMKNAEVVLRALRVLAALGDARHDPTRTVSVGQLLGAADADADAAP